MGEFQIPTTTTDDVDGGQDYDRRCRSPAPKRCADVIKQQERTELDLVPLFHPPLHAAFSLYSILFSVWMYVLILCCSSLTI